MAALNTILKRTIDEDTQLSSIFNGLDLENLTSNQIAKIGKLENLKPSYGISQGLSRDLINTANIIGEKLPSDRELGSIASENIMRRSAGSRGQYSLGPHSQADAFQDLQSIIENEQTTYNDYLEGFSGNSGDGTGFAGGESDGGGTGWGNPFSELAAESDLSGLGLLGGSNTLSTAYSLAGKGAPIGLSALGGILSGGLSLALPGINSVLGAHMYGQDVMSYLNSLDNADVAAITSAVSRGDLTGLSLNDANIAISLMEGAENAPGFLGHLGSFLGFGQSGIDIALSQLAEMTGPQSDYAGMQGAMIGGGYSGGFDSSMGGTGDGSFGYSYGLGGMGYGDFGFDGSDAGAEGSAASGGYGDAY